MKEENGRRKARNRLEGDKQGKDWKWGRKRLEGGKEETGRRDWKEGRKRMEGDKQEIDWKGPRNRSERGQVERLAGGEMKVGG